MPRCFASALATALAAACLGTAPTAAAADPCAKPGYSYGGLIATTSSHGVAASITALAPPAVESGHVAGWVGVGGVAEGPGGTAEWLQVGLNSIPGTGSRLYYEYTVPGEPIRYMELDGNVATGRSVRVAVLETGQPGTWRVWVDGKAASGPIVLPGSRGRLTAIATTESLNDGRETCNRFTYGFDRVVLATAPGGVWRSLMRAFLREDPGYRVVRGVASFTAALGGPGPPEVGEPAADDLQLSRQVQGRTP